MSTSDTSCSDKDEIISEQKEKIQQLQRNIRQLTSRLKTKDESISELEDSINNLEKENKRLKRCPGEVINIGMKEKNEGIENLININKKAEDELHKMQEKNEILDHQIIELSKENERLNTMLASRANDDDDTMSELSKQLDDQYSEIAKKDKEIQKLSKEVKILNEEITEIKIKGDDRLENLNKQVQDQLNEKEFHNKELLSKVARLENEMSELRNTDYSNSLADSGYKNSYEKDEEIDRLKRKLKKMKRTIKDFQAGLIEIGSLANCELQTMDDCVRIFKTTCQGEGKFSNNVNETEIIKRYKIQLEDQEQEKVEFQTTIKELNRKSKRKEKEYKNKLKENQEEIDELSDQIEKLNSSITKLVDKKKVKALEVTIDELEEEMQSKDIELKKKNKRLMAAEERIKEIEVEKSVPKDQDVKKTKEYKALTESNLKLQQELKDLRKEIEIYDEKVELWKNANETLFKDKDELARLLNDANEKIDKKQEAIATMRRKFEAAKISENELQMVIAEKVATIEDHKKEKGAMTERYDFLNRLLSDHKEKVSDLEQQIEILEKAKRKVGVASDRNKFRAKASPLWWKKHQEQRLPGNANQVCPNCNIAIDVDNYQDHVRNCEAPL